MNKEMEESITENLNKAYDHGVRHSIEVVKTIWSYEPLQDPKNNPYLKIIIELQKLQHHDTNNDNG
jgi:hypothetical protein